MTRVDPRAGPGSWPGGHSTGASSTARAAEPFRSSGPQEPAVSGFLHRPAEDARDGLVMTHGAGGDANAPLLRALAAALADAGLAVLRVDLPFRQQRRKGPPSPSGAARDRDGLRRAVDEMRRIAPGRVGLGGTSYGGPHASMLAADEPGRADALLLRSYPLHPPARPADLRTAHFPRLLAPALFAHGSLDPFGGIDEIEAARALIPAPTELVAIDGAGHGLGRGPRAPQPAAETGERLRAAVAPCKRRHAARPGGRA